MTAGCRLEPVVRLACSSCQLVYTPDPADFGNGNTGCPRCGGWTWIAELDDTTGVVTVATSTTRVGGDLR